jgi:uncharacterized membrane protein YgdD (TMEM256/DUF423 family)
MHKNFLMAGAIFGGVGVAAGAFGAHELQNITSDEKVIHGFQTAVQYQIYHALALIAVALILDKMPHRFIRWTGNCFIIGTIFFSGSLYLLTLLKIQGSELTRIIGPITPLGGVFFILGWVMLLAGVIARK